MSRRNVATASSKVCSSRCWVSRSLACVSNPPSCTVYTRVGTRAFTALATMLSCMASELWSLAVGLTDENVLLVVRAAR